MEIQRFAECYMCDALRLAQYLAKRDGAQISEGIGPADDFPFTPKDRSCLDSDARFFRVESETSYCEIGFVTMEEPESDQTKHRNKSIFRVIIGDQIKSFREGMGMSLEELADKSCFRPHSLARIEEGRWDIDLAQLGRILDALGATLTIVKSEE